MFYHFRTGEVVSRDALKLVAAKDYSGFFLANKLHNFLERIRETSKDLLEAWHIKFDNKFFNVGNTF